MNLKQLIILPLLALAFTRCASKAPQPQELPEDANSEITDQVLVDETTNADLGTSKTDEFGAVQNDPIAPTTEPAPPPAVEENLAQNPPPPTQEPPAESNTSELPAPDSAPMVDNGKPATITALDFVAGENGGTVVVRTNHEVIYTTRKNDKNNQFIVELGNTIVPKKFQRPYNTKEFPGAIASLQAYQAKGGKTAANIVIQLRDAADPGVVQEGKMLSISATGGSGGGLTTTAGNPAESANPLPSTPPPEMAEGEQAPLQSEVAAEGTIQDEGHVMTNKSFDAFLMGQSKFYGHPINIEVTNQDVKETFKFISEESGMNLVLDEDITGKVTMKLKKVPWDQALAIILQSKQFGYIKNGSILRIATLKTLASESAAAKLVIDSQKNLQTLRVQIFPLSYAKAEEMLAQVKDFLSPRGKASSDKRTNTLVVTDIPETLSKVKGLMTRLDTQTPQVLIEAKIIEARDTFQRNLGVNWTAVNASNVIGQGAGNTPLRMTNTLSGSIQQSIGTADPTFAVTVGTLDVIGDLTSTLKFMEAENLIKIISAPRILALDRQAATIEQTTQFPLTTTTVTPTSTSTTTTFKDVQMRLKVTPQITVDGSIILDVDILREIAGRVDATTGAREIARRSATTQVLVENGDTAAFGGIYQSDVSDSVAGIPLLKDIPLIGWLFKSNLKNQEKNELVMLLTPKILNKDKAFVKGGSAM